MKTTDKQGVTRRAQLGVRPEVDAMVHSLVTLAHNFGMGVIAEGVETEDQMARITEVGCDEVQGFLLGKPTSDPEMYLESWDGRGSTEASGQEGMDEELVGSAAKGAADERAEDGDPPIALR